MHKKLVESDFTAGAEVKLVNRENETYTCKVSKHNVDLPLNEAATIWIQQQSK